MGREPHESEWPTRHERRTVIGAGPGGLSAAVYAARGGLSTIVFEKALVGGQITVTDEVENYPGMIDSVSGFEIADLFRKHAEKFGAEIVEENVKAFFN
mgnify:CR=1 FL=1